MPYTKRLHQRANARSTQTFAVAVLVGACTVIAPIGVMAQAGGTTTQPAPPAGPVQMPPVTVTAQKEPADAQKLPVSVTAVQDSTIDRAGVTFVSEAAMYAPNTFYSELTARKISNATFRGIGSSPANAGVTTVIDSVPQLNTNSSNLSFRDVEQVEFVRGPQSALFGRNALGGVVNITSRRPGLLAWRGQVLLPFASSSGREVQASASGPLKSGKLALGAAVQYGQRDGFSTNTVTNHTVDDRNSFSGKAQLLWTPSNRWESRLIVGGERDRDGDYTLGDLAAIRQDPFHVARDFEGHTDRDVVSTTWLNRHEGSRLSFSAVTGVVKWRTEDATDLDYSPYPLVTRDNLERDLQFTQEVRLASAANAPVRLSDRVTLHWQTGLFIFTQNYTQDAVNHYAPMLLSQFIEFSVDQHIPQSKLDDVGVGVFGQATFAFGPRVDLSVGARVDHEQKDANLSTFYVPTIAAPTLVDASRGFTSPSPNVSVAFHLQPERTLYASVAQGFKAGGFNPSSPAGSESYDEEHAWHAEGGWKSSWADGRVRANAAAFYIDWQDLQLNTPDPAVLGQFYIANVGNATSRGVELEVAARPHPNVSLFGVFGYTRARFGTGSRSSGVDVSGRVLPNTPETTTSLGVEFMRPVGVSSMFARVESVFYGTLQYDPSNTAEQEAYSLTNLRVGLRGKRLLAEAWIRNAFDTHYVPVAFPYLPFAAFVGEPGHPRTFGVSFGVTF